MTRAKGIDISHWKVVNDWQKVYESGVRFVGIKATEGLTYLDPDLRKNREAVRRQPFLLTIYYHFARPGSARKQAERLVDAIGALRDNERLCLDLEGAGPTPEDPRRAIDWINEFYDSLHAGVHDRRPLMYTSNRIWGTIGDPEWSLASGVDLWVPRYSRKEPVLPKPWRKLQVGQEIEVTWSGQWVMGKISRTDETLGMIAVASVTLDGKPVDANIGIDIDRHPEGENVIWRRVRPGWTIWQWTDGVDPEIHVTPGVAGSGRCDANYFYGDEATLAAYARL